MTMNKEHIHSLLASEEEPEWRKNRDIIRQGFADLEYLPRSRTGWNATLAALAYSTRRQIDGRADLNVWAAMHGCPASARFRELGEHALVLWHGTSAKRARQIREVGLFHKRGLWTTLEPRIAHGFTRVRAQGYEAGSATVVLVLDRRDIRPGIHYDNEGPEILRFYSRLPPEAIEYILWGTRIEFLGAQKAQQPRPWGIARFKRVEGRWDPLSRPPVRFDEERTYNTLNEWLHLSLQRIVSTLGSATAIEMFSSLYSTIAPWDALEHDAIFNAMERLCHGAKSRGGIKQFLLQAEGDHHG